MENNTAGNVKTWELGTEGDSLCVPALVRSD